jgi:hypothetical protein
LARDHNGPLGLSARFASPPRLPAPALSPVGWPLQWVPPKWWDKAHGCERLAEVAAGGPSPRARGTLPLRQLGPQVVRAIPAGAGNTPANTAEPCATPGHPRGRGEHGLLRWTLVSSDGPSPRARGTQCGTACSGRRGRAIPAGAGNTMTSASARRSAPGHPRGRGEQTQTGAAHVPSGGPSPRARGTRSWAVHADPRRRAIPAGAGNNSLIHAACEPGSGHPRGRGEQLFGCMAGSYAAGPSPRARGTRVGSVGSLGHGRAIPAGAGNKRPRSRPRPPTPGHPRGRGEHSGAECV